MGKGIVVFAGAAIAIALLLSVDAHTCGVAPFHLRTLLCRAVNVACEDHFTLVTRIDRMPEMPQLSGQTVSLQVEDSLSDCGMTERGLDAFLTSQGATRGTEARYSDISIHVLIHRALDSPYYAAVRRQGRIVSASTFLVRQMGQTHTNNKLEVLEASAREYFCLDASSRQVCWKAFLADFIEQEAGDRDSITGTVAARRSYDFRTASIR